MDVLAYLAARPGEVVSIEELLSSVWRGVVVSDGSVYIAIKQLRQAMSSPGDESRYIETIPKRGYRLTAPVEHVNPEPAALTIAAASNNRTSEHDATSAIASVGDGLAAMPIALEHTRNAAWRRTGTWSLLAGGVVLALAAIIGSTLPIRDTRRAPTQSRMDLELRLPRSAREFTISPDGLNVVYRAQQQLWLRPLNSDPPRALPGTENSFAPFWSPDSSQVAFTSEGDSTLKKVAIAGGSPVEIVALPEEQMISGWTWSGSGTILFTSDQYAISRVPANGGAVEPATEPNYSKCPFGPRSARTSKLRMLPDGDRFFYVARECDPFTLNVYVDSLTKSAPVHLAISTRRTPQTLRMVETNVAYANGHLLSLFLDGKLMAQPFDPDTATLSGEPVTIAEDVSRFSVSENGTLLYLSWNDFVDPTAQPRRLVRYDRSGQRLGEVRVPPLHRLPRLSPDGDRIAVAAPTIGVSRLSESEDVWTIDLEQSEAVRLTSNATTDTNPVWSRDGSYLAFNSGIIGDLGHPNGIYRRAANGAGTDELLFSPRIGFAMPLDWTRDGLYILFARGEYTIGPRNRSDIWVLPVGKDQREFSLLDSPANKRAARLSPDDRWIAYSTDAPNGSARGPDQIVVQPFPKVSEGFWPISLTGGYEPKWRGDGRELFYLSPEGTLMAVDIDTDSGKFERGEPRPLFATGLKITGSEWPPETFYDVTADGQQFFVSEPIEDSAADSEEALRVHVIVNWHLGLGEE
jgi:DNA-binding winged helix-turn-helix (wHTH) protein/Tol biopolymer transport system component